MEILFYNDRTNGNNVDDHDNRTKGNISMNPDLVHFDRMGPNTL